MSCKASTGFRTRLLGRESVEDILGGGVMRVYSGAQPANADTEAGGLLLGTVTLGGWPWHGDDTGFGLHFRQAGIYTVNAPSAEPWTLRTVEPGTAGWFRLLAPEAVESADDASLSAARIDGSVGVAGSGADLILTAADLGLGQAVPIDSFTYVLLPYPGT
ncbi:MAG TPA: hypothetical protein VFG73_02305 [Rhodanobacteraceae bacterium]|nr:hypothetical protein [Rhodanobacteraceae bacterium]